jgi:glycerol uptake facilitator-like aquaporin
MVVFAFVLGLLFTAAVASVVPFKGNNANSSNLDYHFVPGAGDVFGAQWAR